MHQNIIQRHFPGKILVVFTVIVLALFVVTSGFREKNKSGAGPDGNSNKDSVESVTAFMSVYKVLMNPRCMNCHPAGNVPLQGDDSHIHQMLPRRGQDGKGVYAMKCANCHQAQNTPGLHTPPGNPNWHLPPADMKMVFQGKTPYELAKQLVNPKTNGNKNLQQLIAHADDGLVKGSWNPGEGRAAPPLSYEEFKKAWITWIEKGAYAPKSE